MGTAAILRDIAAAPKAEKPAFRPAFPLHICRVF